MSENTEVVLQVEAPVEQRYTFQPTDDSGRPIGAPQVIKYTTVEELQQKLTDQNILLIRKLREQTKKVRLGIDEREEISDDAQRFSGPVEFSPRELTEEQRYDIARRLTDPTTAAEATQELVEAQLGAPLADLGRTLQSTQQELVSLRAKYEVNAFIAENPDYYKCPENQEAITSWMLRYELAPVRSNFQKAYDTLKAQGILIEGAAPAPVVVPVPEPVEQVLDREPLPVVEPKVEQPVVRIPSGLTREQTSDTGTPVSPGSEITYVINGRTLTGNAALAAMPSEEYKRRLLTDRNFGKLVDKLDQESRKK
jgi:hypothetical protein